MRDYKNIELPRLWHGQTAVCIAGGASLNKAQVSNVKGFRTIAINDAYKLAPWADILYACDGKWWEWHNGVPEFQGYKLTHEQEIRWWKLKGGLESEVINPPYKGIDIIISNGPGGYDDKPDRIRHGGNSGYQAINIAMKLGAKRIILLGYDMHARGAKSHWFGEHPNGRQRDGRYDTWLKEFPALQEAAMFRGQEIINCTPDSDLKCFKLMSLSDFLFDNNSIKR